MVISSYEEVSDEEGSQGGIPVVRFTTASVPRSGRFDAWQQTIGILFDIAPARGRDGGAFSAAMTAYHFGRFVLCHSRVDGARYMRSDERLQWDDLDHYLLHLPLQQAVSFSWAGGGRHLRPMESGVLDLTRSAHICAAAGAAVTLLVPRYALSPLLQKPDGQHGQVLRRETPVGAFLARHLMALAVAAPWLRKGEASAIAAPILGLVAACLDLGPGTDTLPPALARYDLTRRVRAHIEQNLHREGLSPASLIKDLGISRSQLYRLFEGLGGVHHYIRQRRLRRCLLALCNLSLAGQRIADIAYDHGFTDQAHFSRLFRQSFGLSPRAARMAAQHGDRSVLAALLSTRSDAPPFAQWVRELMAG